MTLPVGVLPKATFKGIEIRSLSRTEALHIKVIAEDLEASERWILQCGTDSTEQEVDAYRASNVPQVVDDLVEAIAQLSGIMPAVNGSGPKA